MLIFFIVTSIIILLLGFLFFKVNQLMSIINTINDRNITIQIDVMKILGESVLRYEALRSQLEHTNKVAESLVLSTRDVVESHIHILSAIDKLTIVAASHENYVKTDMTKKLDLILIQNQKLITLMNTPISSSPYGFPPSSNSTFTPMTPEELASFLKAIQGGEIKPSHSDGNDKLEKFLDQIKNDDFGDDTPMPPNSDLDDDDDDDQEEIE